MLPEEEGQDGGCQLREEDEEDEHEELRAEKVRNQTNICLNKSFIVTPDINHKGVHIKSTGRHSKNMIYIKLTGIVLLYCCITIILPQVAPSYWLTLVLCSFLI